MNSYTFFHDKQDKKGLSCLVLLHIYVNTYLDMEEIETTACNNFLGDRKSSRLGIKITLYLTGNLVLIVVSQIN